MRRGRRPAIRFVSLENAHLASLRRRRRSPRLTTSRRPTSAFSAPTGIYRCVVRALPPRSPRWRGSWSVCSRPARACASAGRGGGDSGVDRVHAAVARARVDAGSLPLDRTLLVVVPACTAGRHARRADLVSSPGRISPSPRRLARLRPLWCGSSWPGARRGPSSPPRGRSSRLRCILTAPGTLVSRVRAVDWYAFWTDPVRRGLYITSPSPCFAWAFVAAGWALAVQLARDARWARCSRRSARVLAVPAAVVGIVGLESALTVWNDQMGLLPWGLFPHPRYHGVPRHPVRDPVVRRRTRRPAAPAGPRAQPSRAPHARRVLAERRVRLSSATRARTPAGATSR